MIRVATAGWQIPRAVRDAFPEEGSTLQRYAARFPGVEINATFYKPPRPATLARWAETTPQDFRFAFKAPKAVTHEARLVGADEPFHQFLSQISIFGDKLGPVLVQLPPKLAYDRAVAAAFFSRLRDRFDGEVACEPRHVSWFEPEADAMLAGLRIARVAADPALVPAAAEPGGWRGLGYWRLHGSPRMYWSAYDQAQIEAVARAAVSPAWIVFDNTASGAAGADALAMLRAL